jgi:hypothetical protein
LQCSRIRLAWKLWPLRGKPCHDIGDIFGSHGLAGHIVTPIGRAQFGPSDNHGGPKGLVAYEPEIRAINNRAGPAAAAIGAMT